jgi:CHAD domain-containing protein
MCSRCTLRIDFKRFRYALEIFEEVLGPEIKNVIKDTKIMQDHLGDLNDTRVAGEVLQGITTDYQQQYSGVPVFLRPDLGGVATYAAAQQAEQQRLMEAFPAVWANFNRDAVR